MSPIQYNLASKSILLLIPFQKPFMGCCMAGTTHWQTLPFPTALSLPNSQLHAVTVQPQTFSPFSSFGLIQHFTIDISIHPFGLKGFMGAYTITHSLYVL